VSSISYAGHDLAGVASAELLEPVAHAVAPVGVRVPGRPGLALLGGEVEPLELRVRVFLDAPAATTDAGRALVRARIRSWLLVPAGGELVVPGEPTLRWRDAVCTGISDWSTLFSEGSAVVTFLCMDPIAYGAAGSSAAGSFAVGGTWPTWPVVELVARAGAAVSVACGGATLAVECAFRAGDLVSIDCAAQRVTVNGTDASADVTLGSDFFAIGPGDVAPSFSGCSSHVMRWVERWA
jgi:hypothetical protein